MEKYRIGTLFPNTNETIAFYSPTAFCITLLTITERQLSQINHKMADAIAHRKVLYHEMRHNIDHLSTLWGQHRILNLFEAVDSRLKRNADTFHTIVKYKIEEKQFHFDNYYLEQHQQVTYNSPADNWIWSLSAGIRFSDSGVPLPDRPILFINFFTADRRQVARVPLSIATLLETNALFEETEIELQALASYGDDKANKIKGAFERSLFKNVIYNQNMALYNAAVHLCANILGLADMYEAFRIASAIATTVLNLPEELIGGIPINKEYSDTWKERTANFIKNHNYGFLYLNTLKNYSTVFIKNGAYSLNDYLSANALPDSATLFEIVKDKFERISKAFSKDAYLNKFFQDQSLAGLELLKMRGLNGNGLSVKDTALSGVYTPFVVAKDTNFRPGITFGEIVRNAGITPDVPITEWYHLANDINKRMEEFYLIRGI